MRKSKIVISFVLLLLVIISSINVTSTKVAFADTGNVNIEMTLTNVITGTKNFNTTGAGPGLHPGDDYRSDDNYIRTLDVITYQLDYSVNPAGGIGKNTTITSTIPLNAEGKVVAIWEDKLQRDYAGLIISDNGRTLTYNIGDVNSGKAFTFAPTARVLSSAKNGEKFSVFASIKADNAVQKITQPYEVIVSALPKADLINQSAGYFKADGPNGEKGKAFLFSIGLAVGDGKGSEDIEGPVTFTADLSNFGLANAKLYNFDGRPAVGVNNDGRYIDFLPYGKTTANQPIEKSIAGTPSITASQNSAGANVSITINNIDKEGRYFPAKNANDTTISIDQKYLFAGYIALWVDEKDIPVGNSTITNKYSNLYLTGTSGNLNYGGKSEPLENNIVSYNIYKTQAGIGQLNYLYVEYMKDATDFRKLPTQTERQSGDGVVYPGQSFGLFAYTGNNGTIPLNNFEMIAKIDPTKVKVTDIDGTTGIAHKLDLKNCISDDLQVQYGTGTYATYEAQRNDNGEGTVWYNSTTEAIASGNGPINKVRVITKPGKSLPVDSSISIGLNVTALNNEINTILPAFATMRADEVNNGNWSLGAYNPTSHNIDQGDRVILTQLLSRIELKTADGIQSSEVAKEVVYKLYPTLTVDSRYSNITTAENVFITNTIPKGLIYVSGSSDNEPSSVVKNQDGTTTILWNLKNVNLNKTIEPISYKVMVDFNIKNGTNLENKAVISTSLDSSAEKFRTSIQGINITNLAAWGISKETDKDIIEVGDDLTYTLKYAVFKDQEYTDFKFIDILPYNGDIRSPKSDFDGNYEIKDIIGSNGEKFYFTEDEQDTINTDPGVNTSTWVEYTKEAAAGKKITALKIHADKLTANDGAKYIKLKLAPHSNKAGNVYVNNFSGRVSNVDAVVQSNDVPIRVISSSIGEYVWNDKNFNKVKDLDEQGLKDITVKLYDESGNIVTSTLTDSDGHYNFNELHSGKYTVKVDKSNIPSGYEETYDLDNVLDNSTEVTLTGDNQRKDVNFGYAQRVGDLVVKYLEKGTDKELSDQEDTTKPVGTDYTTIKRDITDYNFVEVKGNATGKYVEGTTEVTYYYEKKQGNLVVKYLEKGTDKELSALENATKPVGTDYATTKKDITGYNFVNVVGNEAGRYVEGTTEVTYYYEKKQGNLVVKYLEKGTDKELLAPENAIKPVGADYATIKKDITDYNFVNVVGNEAGKYVEGTTEVTYYYEKKQQTVIEIPVDPTEIEIPEDPIPLGQAKIDEPDTIKLPKTGSNVDTSNLIIIGLMLTMLGGVILIKKKR